MSQHRSVPASSYNFEQLAEIYNQTRVDYIVPMPMNARRMMEYVRDYDIDLDRSVVSLNHAGEESGVGMVGVRGERGWVTRLGVIPERRGRHLGQYLMERMLEEIADAGCSMVQLEVIVGNVPAHSLFLKLGFEDVRELLVIRRAPAQLDPYEPFEAAQVETIDPADIPAHLAKRDPYASWVEETASLLNAGSLTGLTVELPSGECGWVILQQSPFQLTHFVLKPDISDEMGLALLYHTHRTFSRQDTKLENIPTDHPTVPYFQQFDYFEVFRRTEMYLYWR